MAETTRRARRPPPPAPMPRLRAPAQPPASARTGETSPPAPRDPLLNAVKLPDWRPLPYPTLMRNAPPPEDDYDPVGARGEPLIGKRLAWAGMMSWVWGVVVLLLVVSPVAAVGKLVTPSSQPVVAAGYGALVAPFGFIAVVVAFGAGIWLWLAMGHEYTAPEDDSTAGL